MRISAKGRYALAAMVFLSDHFKSGENITILNISETLGISKIYLEQIFAILKKSSLVISIKGSQGGYQLYRSPDKITVYDILSSTETNLFEETEPTVSQKSASIEGALQSMVFKPLTVTIETSLKNVTLYDLLIEAKKYGKDNYVFYI